VAYFFLKNPRNSRTQFGLYNLVVIRTEKYDLEILEHRICFNKTPATTQWLVKITLRSSLSHLSVNGSVTSGEQTSLVCPEAH
jgi:hypothetical protein